MVKLDIHTPPLVRIGTSSFSESDWIGPFYPDGTRPAHFLTYYATQFNSVEIDATYYAIPAPSTVEGWNNKTPDDFLISCKFPKSIVHSGEGLKPDPSRILMPDSTYHIRDNFLSVISGLKDRLGVLVLQFPYFNRTVFSGFPEFAKRLDQFLSQLPREFRYAVETRNRSWLNPQLAEICRQHNVALTLVDQAWMPHGDEVMRKFDPVTTDFSYIRLLGDRKAIEKLTTSWEKEVIDHGERLDRWVDVIKDLQQRDVNALIYVNNHYAGHAPTTVRRLQSKLQVKST